MIPPAYRLGEAEVPAESYLCSDRSGRGFNEGLILRAVMHQFSHTDLEVRHGETICITDGR
jgi:hypothetical protein